MVADLLRGVTGGPGSVLVDRAAFGRGEDAGGNGSADWRPAVAQFRQSQVGGEFPAAVPDRASSVGGVGGEGDGVAGDLAGVASAEPFADADARGVEVGEELSLAGGGGCGGGDRAAQRDPGWFAPATAAGFLRLRPGRPVRGGPVAGGGGPQPEPVLGGAAGLADAVVV